MNNDNLRNIDLNLLVYLNALLDEQSISKAALRLHISQPALSNALKRLRLMLNDNLLVRSHQGMVATPLAKSVHSALKQVLFQLETEVLAKKFFDPSINNFQFNTAFYGYEEALIFPVLMQNLSLYPGINLINRAPNRHILFDALARSVIHFTSATIGNYSDIKRKLWLMDEFAIIAHRDFDESTLNATTYFDQNHLLITPQGEESIVDTFLLSSLKKRKIKLSVSEFGYAPILLTSEKTLISTIPKKIAAVWIKHFSLKILPCPVNLPSLKIYLSWHKNADNHPAMMWFKEMLFRIGNY